MTTRSAKILKLALDAHITKITNDDNINNSMDQRLEIVNNKEKTIQNSEVRIEDLEITFEDDPILSRMTNNNLEVVQVLDCHDASLISDDVITMTILESVSNEINLGQDYEKNLNIDDIQETENDWHKNEENIEEGGMDQDRNEDDRREDQTNDDRKEDNTESDGDDRDWISDQSNDTAPENEEEEDEYYESQHRSDTAVGDETSANGNKRKRLKRHNVRLENWTRERNTKNRESGLDYLGRKKIDGSWKYNIHKPPKTMKEKCRCSTNSKITQLKCSMLTEADRNLLFKTFWKMSWSEKHVFVTTLVEKKEVQRSRNRKEEGRSRRSCSYIFHLQKSDGSKVRVCKTMFTNTLSIKPWTVSHWLTCERKQRDNIQPELRSVPVNKNKTDKTLAETEGRRIRLKEFFDSMPKMESHYCRSSSSKLYLEPRWKSKRELYELYKTWSSTNYPDDRPLCIALFHQIFSDLSLSLFLPKKDECDLCVSHRTKNVEDEEYNLHQMKKQEARTEKDQDKNSSSDDFKVFTMDMQAVLLSPKSNVSALYYKTKLAVHNFTLFDLKTKDGFCFLWHESEGGLVASVYASIVAYFLSQEIDKERKPNYILYSDGCTSQNRNVTMANALLNLAILKNVTIVQKYLERGHTQMECDSIHSTIERQLNKTVINVPADYVKICKDARKNPMPYHVQYLNHTFFKDFTQLQYYNTIRPGITNTVNDLRQLKYNSDGTIDYKLRHVDGWTALPRRRRASCNNVTPTNLDDLPSLYRGPIPIKKIKYDHLMSLKSTMAKDYHAFYDQLPHIN